MWSGAMIEITLKPVSVKNFQLGCLYNHGKVGCDLYEQGQWPIEKIF